MQSKNPQPLIYCVLGRYGDLMILLPGLKALFDSTGLTPIVVVSTEFSDIFDGVSYAVAHPVTFQVYSEVKQAVQFAIDTYGDCIVPKWWDDPRHNPPPLIPEPWLKVAKLTLPDGRKVVLPASDWDSYMTSQWEHAGFTREQMLEWPVVFDRRSPEREADLIRRVFRSNKPKLLYNFGGVTSPMPKDIRPQMFHAMHNLSVKYEVVDLSSIRAHRIFDLLGLYDVAAGLITTDTATLHLASASRIQYVALVADGGSGSVPRGNCVLKVRYHALRDKKAEIFATLKSFA